MYYPAGKPIYPEKPSENICGEGYLEEFENPPPPQSVRAIFVKFTKGAYTKWHTHSGDQLLYGIRGKGFVEMEGTQTIKLKKGDRVIISGGVRHRHGARKEKSFVHLAVTTGETDWNEEDPCDKYSNDR
jgi:quercetin dioxygenase-like cupin family protein